jgi:hypothetical protein
MKLADRSVVLSSGGGGGLFELLEVRLGNGEVRLRLLRACAQHVSPPSNRGAHGVGVLPPSRHAHTVSSPFMSSRVISGGDTVARVGGGGGVRGWRGGQERRGVAVHVPA